MAFHSILRVRYVGRKAGARATTSSTQPETGDRRHPAMSGLNVSPVHGRHCICNRCAPDEREQRLPLAG